MTLLGSAVDQALNGLRIVIWPATVLALILLFRRQVAERLGALRSAELPGGIRLQLDALKKEVAENPAVQASTAATSVRIVGVGEIGADRFYSVAGVRVDLERMLRRLSRAALRDGEFVTRDLDEIVLDLRDAGELAPSVARQVQNFLRLAGASFGMADVSDDDIVNLLTAGSLLTAHVHYRERVASIASEFWGHDLASHVMHMERGRRDLNPKERWAAIATILPEVDYNYAIFMDALRRAAETDDDRNWPRGMAREFLTFVVPRSEFFEIAKFRRDQLRRLLRDGEGRWWSDEGQRRDTSSSDWRYYVWPESWGEIRFNVPVNRGGPDEVADDLLHAEAAVRRLRVELDDVHS